MTGTPSWIATAYLLIAIVSTPISLFLSAYATFHVRKARRELRILSSAKDASKSN